MLEQEFVRAVQEIQAQSGEGLLFRETAERMTGMLVDIAWINSKQKVRYLKPLIDHAKKQERIVVATLNYDNAVELAAKKIINCVTGIEEWSEKGTLNIQGPGLHLLKLHGSIDWQLQQHHGTEEIIFPYTKIKRINPTTLKDQSFKPVVIFGQRNKLTAEGPFLDLLKAFQKELMQANILTVVGYSFRDDHINTYLSQWLSSKSEHHIRIIDPKFEESSTDYVVKLRRLREDSPKQVRVISKGAGAGLAELYGSSEAITS